MSNHVEPTGRAAKNLSPYRRPNQSRISMWNRGRKWRRFQKAISPTRDTTVLDVGYSEREWSEADNYLEKHYPWQGQITALGIEDHKMFSERYPDVQVAQYPGGAFPFDDDAFDVVWSNAVVEHVGDRDAQVAFIREMARVGRRAFFTTPNRHFPVEVHTRTPFLHWLPKRWFDAYLNRTKQQWAAGSYMRLISVREMRGLLRDAGVADYTIQRNRLGPFTLDFVVIIGDGGPRGAHPNHTSSVNH